MQEDTARRRTPCLNSLTRELIAEVRLLRGSVEEFVRSQHPGQPTFPTKTSKRPLQPIQVPQTVPSLLQQPAHTAPAQEGPPRCGFCQTLGSHWHDMCKEYPDAASRWVRVQALGLGTMCLKHPTHYWFRQLQLLLGSLEREVLAPEHSS